MTTTEVITFWPLLSQNLLNQLKNPVGIWHLVAQFQNDLRNNIIVIPTLNAYLNNVQPSFGDMTFKRDPVNLTQVMMPRH